MLKQNFGQQTRGIIACEQQTHFRSSLLSAFRREGSDDWKCVCCSQARSIREDVQMENMRFASLKKPNK